MVSSFAELKRMLQESYEQPFANKLDEMDKFLAVHNCQNWFKQK